ncbi:MAG: hypothetical protein HFJ08_06910 [Lachnospiraceae bacterium]|nr:hypothetical protein [Lachnospiraceae bacterium]
MQLQRLTEGNLEYLKGKKVYCIGSTESYIREFCDTYQVRDNIVCVGDRNVRNRSVICVDGIGIPIEDVACLKGEDLSEKVLVITDDYYQEKYQLITEVMCAKQPNMTIYYFANKETEYELKYREQYKDITVENIIIFRSGPHASAYVKGMDFADNARALFEYMLENGYNEKYELVWFVKNPEEFEQYNNVINVKFMSFDWSVSENEEERNSYYHALCLAKYIFFTDAYGFARNCRKDQTRVQLWHGCGFKTRVNFVRCEKRYEYTTVISDVYSKIHQDIYGLREDQILVTGYAKQDWLFHPVMDWKERLGIPKAEKYVFWLPTFRSANKQLENLNEYELFGQMGLPVVYTYEMLEQLDALLERFDIVLVIKLHPFQNREKVDKIDMKNIVMLDNGQLAEKDIQINQLLGHADALISDYSSAAIDYMVLDRPIAFTLDDVEEYRQSRGFVFDSIKEWLPGMEIETFDDMCIFIKEVGSDIDSTSAKRKMLMGRMHKYQDDNNSRRIIEALQI